MYIKIEHNKRSNRNVAVCRWSRDQMVLNYIPKMHYLIYSSIEHKGKRGWIMGMRVGKIPHLKPRIKEFNMLLSGEMTNLYPRILKAHLKLHIRKQLF